MSASALVRRPDMQLRRSPARFGRFPARPDGEQQGSVEGVRTTVLRCPRLYVSQQPYQMLAHSNLVVVKREVLHHGKGLSVNIQLCQPRSRIGVDRINETR
jgi:hypothetical protein